MLDRRDPWTLRDPDTARPPTKAEAAAIAPLYAEFEDKWGPERIAAALRRDGLQVPTDTVRIWYHQNVAR